MSKQDHYASIHYHDYLQIDKLLDAQHLRSEALNEPAHEEMLFIIVHQVYELWFKQIIHELKSLQTLFKQELVDERSIGTAVGRLERVMAIQQLLIEQIRVMETMTPLDFLDFRKHLFPASGFQSYQFRQVEVLLGLPAENRLTYNHKPYHCVFQGPQKEYLEETENEGTLFKSMETWLERTPFLKFGNFNFLEAYHDAVRNMMAREYEAIQRSPLLDEEAKTMRKEILKANEDYIMAVTDPDQHSIMVAEGKLRLSYRATMAALFINLYRDEPILRQPFLFLQRLSEVDENLTAWRTRHAQMVLRMLGRKMGTGGSSGHDYLAATAAKHVIYSDLHNISTLLIPRMDLPVLPEDLKQNLSFFYTTKGE